MTALAILMIIIAGFLYLKLSGLEQTRY